MEKLEKARTGNVAPLRAAGFERRGTSRIHTVMRVAKVTRGGDVGLWRVRNMSDEGMMLLSALPVVPGERLTLRLSPTVAIEATAIWWNEGRCGVQFDEPIDCATLLHDLCEEQRSPGYRPPRLPVDTRATVYCEKGLHSVHLYDLSQHGAAFTHSARFVPGLNVKLVFENGEEHRGVIRWSGDGKAGIYLTEPFPCARLESAASL